MDAPDRFLPGNVKQIPDLKSRASARIAHQKPTKKNTWGGQGVPPLMIEQVSDSKSGRFQTFAASSSGEKLVPKGSGDRRRTLEVLRPERGPPHYYEKPANPNLKILLPLFTVSMKFRKPEPKAPVIKPRVLNECLYVETETKELLYSLCHEGEEFNETIKRIAGEYQRRRAGK